MEGPVTHSGLQLLKKNGGNVDTRNAFGLTPLHIATWRNHVPMVKKLLAAGAHPDAKVDGESEWSSLHRALHFGHLSIASVLLQAGASLTVENSKCHTPIDLISGPVTLAVGDVFGSVATEVFSWGSGTNYQIGTGNAHIQKLPCKIDALQGSYVSKRLEHEGKQLNGHNLGDQQIVKIQMRSSLEGALANLGFPLETESKLLTSGLPDGKGNRKAELSNANEKEEPKSSEVELPDPSSDDKETLDIHQRQLGLESPLPHRALA
ncbi:hypothetical protein ZIOFF_047304 [Zingiber officinale]|uniref:Uncharacterized protein n=1 Tax=Zingiber officinale TaxID=94328 RepID=A0A8J5KPV9_ZINOF|nr:hypothetical protein ZIOFF_047304 [Zingiber officinale]